MRKVIIVFFALVTITAIFSCANRGSGPQGGPVDVTPPSVVRYSPADGSTHMTRNRIEITFDEIVVLQNASKVVVSPPQHTPADIKAVSHKVIIEFADSLLDSTTYSIDFTDAIADNNEGNKLDGFTYCFTTGDHLDSLEILGRVLNAENLNPSVGITVGVHPLSDVFPDSSFLKSPFTRITKTNDDGYFVIRNLPPGTYSVYALNDIGGNFLKDMPTEEIAFLDTTFTPMRTVESHFDTIYNALDSTIIDTVISHRKVTTSPDDLLLMSFVELDTRRFLDKVQRPDRHRLITLFNGSDSVVPTLTPINFPDSLFSNVVTFNENHDTITFWLRDTTLWKIDTLSCLLSYTRHDVDSIYLASDTVNFIYRYNKTAKTRNKSASISRAGKKQKDEKKETPKLASSNASSKFEINSPLIVRFAMPTDIRPHDTVSYHLQVIKDSLWYDVPNVSLVKADEGGTLFSLKHEWKPSTSYRLILDSSLCVNMIGQTNALETINFTVKSLEEYSKLILHLFGVSGNEVIQLLDAKDQVVRQIALSSQAKTASPSTDSTQTQAIKAEKYDVTFEYVTPGIYFMRLFSDSNNDGVWTPGQYSEKRQPEEVIYFPYDIELRAFWDVEEDWTPSTTRLSKPRELIPT
ncbi:MAG: Ig-like domain-containing protein, partial [Paludibacteraceae bacterium]|nr:Ig-like domain-containing protein [Paludibacteraceae bacterium]